ncbi:MAG: Holliday junction branch migration protein RuvA [Eubacterium sp.]|nr:Holliday junction branch migration protein RuvA [Eubacterium sp.]
MISHIRGILDSFDETSIVIESNNIGFEIMVPTSTIQELPHVGSEVKIYTYMSVREDDISLYGFITRDDLEMFKLLIKVSGIGPKVAVGILSTLDIDTLRMAILSDDAAAIAKAPGIGKKTAGKLVLELKDRIQLDESIEKMLDRGEMRAIAGGADDKSDVREALEALTSLGFSQNEAKKAISGIEEIETMDVEAIIKEALKKL